MYNNTTRIHPCIQPPKNTLLFLLSASNEYDLATINYELLQHCGSGYTFWFERVDNRLVFRALVALSTTAGLCPMAGETRAYNLASYPGEDSIHNPIELIKQLKASHHPSILA